VQWHREQIQSWISIAAMEHWPDELAIRGEVTRLPSEGTRIPDPSGTVWHHFC
jgi:hypothetical protein